MRGSRAGGTQPLPFEGRRILVAGVGVSGKPAAIALAARGAHVTAVDGAEGDRQRAAAGELEQRGVHVLLGEAASAVQTLADVDLVVTSPGWRPDSPLLAAAAQRGVPVWGDVELAWELRPPGSAPWLCVTGTNGKTTTVRMLASILTAAGRRAVAAGNVGRSLIEAVLEPEPYDVLAVELSSFQLHWAPSPQPLAAAVLNVAPDHLDWHGSLGAYENDKGRIYSRALRARVFNRADPVTRRLADAAAGSPGRVVGFGLSDPPEGALGVRDDVLVDAAFGDRGEGASGVTALAPVSSVQPAAPHNVENALAAAALARAYGVPASAVRDGLRSFRPDAHRIALVARAGGVEWVDDSKATNASAAAASLRSRASVVWIAGGLAKGAVFDDLVRDARGRLRGVVLLGADRALLRDALGRHAPDVPVVEVSRTDTGAMDAVVEAAARLARPGDTVLLAPACASMDMFGSYAQRGDAFAAAVRRLASPTAS